MEEHVEASSSSSSSSSTILVDLWESIEEKGAELWLGFELVFCSSADVVSLSTARKLLFS